MPFNLYITSTLIQIPHVEHNFCIHRGRKLTKFQINIFTDPEEFLNKYLCSIIQNKLM